MSSDSRRGLEEKVRCGEDSATSTRDECAPRRKSLLRRGLVNATCYFIFSAGRLKGHSSRMRSPECGCDAALSPGDWQRLTSPYNSAHWRRRLW